MAPEVRFVPPRFAFPLLLLLAAFPAQPVPAQENPPPPQSQSAVEARARLLQELDSKIEQRRSQLAREEEALAALRQALETAKQDLVAERERLAGLKQEVEADLARRERVVDERLSQIARVYAAMKPREASQALQGMDDDMAVAILERLPGRAVGKIFDLMDKERVRDLTRRLEAGRSVKKE